MIVTFFGFDHFTQMDQIDRLRLRLVEDRLQLFVVVLWLAVRIREPINQWVIAGRIHRARNHLCIDRIGTNATAPLTDIRRLQGTKFKFTLERYLRQIGDEKRRGFSFDTTGSFLRLCRVTIDIFLRVAFTFRYPIVAGAFFSIQNIAA